MRPSPFQGDMRWIQTFELPGNQIITGHNDIAFQQRCASIVPERLDGMTVVDVGAGNGWHCFEAGRRGAARCFAIESTQNPGYEMKRGFDIVRPMVPHGTAQLNWIDGDAHDIVRLLGGTIADVVLCFGLLYHLEGPLYFLSQARKIMKSGALIAIETHVRDLGRGMQSIYELSDNPDHTTYWGHDPSAITIMLQRAGFSAIEQRGRWHDRVLITARS